MITSDQLLNSLPNVERTPFVENSVRDAYSREIENISYYTKNAVNPSVGFDTFRQSGNQFIAEFWVNDLVLEKKNQYNWHMQNTSQWLYAGCILLQDGKVSTHH